MTPSELHAQQELDRDILAYVREMQQHAPVTAESIHGFESGTRRRRVTLPEIRDRLAYLEGCGYAKSTTEWHAGECTYWAVTADGMDFLDGAAPPRNWSGKRG